MPDNIIITGLGDRAADADTIARARLFDALSPASRRTDGSGVPVRRLFERVYTTNLRDEPEAVLVRNAWKVVGTLHPGLVISARSAVVARPVRTLGPDSVHFVFLTGPYRRSIDWPGLELRIFPGPGPLPGDIPYLGLFLASPERRCLENLVPTRQVKGVPRTTGRAGVESFLAMVRRTHGEEGLRDLVRRAAGIEDALGAAQEFELLVLVADALLRRGDPSVLSTPEGIALSRGEAVDPACAATLDRLFEHLAANPVPGRTAEGTGRNAETNAAFVEAYFSNYIEGTRFTVAEARGIVFDGKVPDGRASDARDLTATFAMLSGPDAPEAAPTGCETFFASLRAAHARLMAHRPDVRPGAFKERPNRAGNTVFVDPDAVVGTLRYGHDLLCRIADPFARAVFVHYLVAAVHPFDDGNGRIARILMSAELRAGGLAPVVVPTVYRDDYIGGLRALTRNGNAGAGVRALDRCQGIAAAIVEDDLDACIARWASTHAFLHPGPDARLTDPTDEPAVFRDGVPAPLSHWESLDGAGDPFALPGLGA